MIWKHADPVSHLRPPDSESVSGLKKKTFKIYPHPHSHQLMILKHTHILKTLLPIIKFFKTVVFQRTYDPNSFFSIWDRQDLVAFC